MLLSILHSLVEGVQGWGYIALTLVAVIVQRATQKRSSPIIAQDWINKWREQGYTLREITNGLGVDHRTVERMASGETKIPKIGTIARMMKFDQEQKIPTTLKKQRRIPKR